MRLRTRAFPHRRCRLFGLGFCLPLWLASSTFTEVAIAGLPDAPSGAPSGALPEPSEEIERLEAEWPVSANPDSIQFRLALARRDEGSLENRLLALDTIDELRTAYGGRRDYEWERARTLLVCGQPFNARRGLEGMLARDSLDIPVRSEIARLRVKEMLRHYDFGEIDEVLSLLEGTVEIAPDLVDNLNFTSFVYYLAARRPGVDPLLLSELGRQRAETVIELRPDDPRAPLLRAVHLVELGRWDEADLQFQAVLPRLPEEQRAVFEALPFGTEPGLRQRWEETSPEDRPRFTAAVWRGRDPSPLTPVDENRIEYWSRVVLCDLLFRNEPQGVPGWETDPGRTFLRYGFPTQNVYSPGAIEELASDMKAHPWKHLTVGRTLQGTFDFHPPAWNWRYEFSAGGSFDFQFEDINFQGTFRKTDETNKLLLALERSVPAIYDGALPGRIQRIFTRAPAFAGTDTTTAQWVEVAVPPWVTPRPESWWQEATLEIVIRDRMSRPVAFRKRKLDARSIYRPTESGEIVVSAEEFDLAPGDYWVETNVADGRIGEHGSLRRRLQVRQFGPAPLEISDLRLFSARMTLGDGEEASLVPSPLGWVARARDLLVWYEVYSQVPGPHRLQVRYTILPKTYLLTIRELIRRGELRADDPRALGGIGMRAGSLELTQQNYSDVIFPEESITPDREGRMPRRAVLDLAGLEPGEYAVVATVTEAGVVRSASAVCSVRIVSDGELQALVDP